ncbi:MAG: DNA polymerase III subunit alpha [Coriobacteriia bacterium]|nr:DNA polymerase III subunit alpha [Coriobacteriia bacterium]
MAFVHLHNHTEYSLLDGQTHIEDMVRRAADLGMPAIAITDHGVMSGVPELSAACDKIKDETGKVVKPIYGCEIYFTDDEELKKDYSSKLYHMILLAKTNEGYHNLIKLVSKSHVDNFYRRPRTTFSMLQKYCSGMIGTSACVAGLIPMLLDNGQFDQAKEWARKLSSCFAPGDFYIELQDQGIKTNNGMLQHELNVQLTNLAKERNLQTVAANDFHYLLKEDADTQDIMLCIGTNSKVNETNRLKFANNEFYMKTEEEMRAAMADFPEACDNTVSLAEKCNVVLERDSILPKFPLPEGETEESYFKKMCEEGLKKRYGDPVPKEAWDRYEYEAGVIIQQGFPAYFLIVQEYIAWARENGIGVGPGRGSAAGAIVAYALGITDLDPLENGLMFERFLSPERVEMPDIDVDFDDERREEVVDHVREVYGDDHVAKVITFGKMKAKNAVRDAARVLDYPYKDGDDICKLIGNDIGTTIDSALADNIDLKNKYDTEDSAKHIINAAHNLEGRIRNEGVHACATIICRDPMSDHVPLKRAVGKNDDVITQYDGDYTPGLGLLKMDFLGLRTLGVLTRACRDVEERYGKHIVPEDIPIDDEKAFKLIQSGNTDGLFQVESALYKRLFNQIPPHRFSDIVVAIALNRTGPLESGMVDDYVRVVQGKDQPNFYDERLKPVLYETYGSIVYQEQIMQISMVMCGFSAGKADKLRKAIGKKKIDIMRDLKEDWCKGAVENNYTLELANQIWDDVEKFAKYAFNKSHSAAYAILVMRTAYMKAHYPNEYMAAVLTSYMNKNERLIKYIASCNYNGTPVLPPDINASHAVFTPVDEGIRFGLVGLRGVGTDVAASIVKERELNGPYKHIHDFVSRLDSKCCNRRVMEALVKGGAFDSTGYTRKQMMYFIDETSMLSDASKRQKDKAQGQASLFDVVEELEDDVPEPDGIEWPQRELLHKEKEIMNMYVTDNPVRPYMPQISQLTRHNISELAELDHDIPNGTFGGMISDIQLMRTKKGKLMSKFNLEDTTGHIETICFDHEKYANVIQEDKIVTIKGKFERGDRGNQIITYQVTELELDETVQPQPTELNITINDDMVDESRISEMNKIFADFKGNDEVNLKVKQADGTEITAKMPFKVDSSDQNLVNKLIQLFDSQITIN